MSKGKVISLSLLVILLGITIFFGIKAVGFYKEYSNTVSTDGEEVEVVIEEGTSTKGIAKILKEKGLIKYEASFVMNAKNSEYGNKLRYGTFTLHKGMSIPDMLKTIASGKGNNETIKVVIPEGYTVQMIAKRLEENGICSQEDFLKAANTLEYDFDFLKDLKVPSNVDYVLQGFLFPATYEWKAGTDATEIVRQMLQAFQNQMTTKELEKIKQSKQSLYDIITMASIVEREARVDSERPTIAGVIVNRLDIDMKLQMCPTVLYPVTEGMYDVNQVLYKDLEIDSPYNTYKNSGLPVGPICSPGLASIKAVLNPEEHDYLFYHTDGTSNGTHIFTKTYEEHEDTRIKK